MRSLANFYNFEINPNETSHNNSREEIDAIKSKKKKTRQLFVRNAKKNVVFDNCPSTCWQIFGVFFFFSSSRK